MAIHELPKVQPTGYLYRKFPNVAITASAGTTDVVDLRLAKHVMIRKVSGDVTSLTPHVSGEGPEGTDFAALFDSSPGAVTITLQAGWQDLPAAILPAGAVKFVGNDTGVIDVAIKG